MIEKISKFVTILQYWITLPLMIVLCLVTFLQVLFRYVFNAPLYWSEELARYLFVWVSFIGFGLAVSQHKEMSVAYFVKFLSKKNQTIIEIMISVIILLFLVLVIYEGFTLAIESYDLPSIALSIPWTYIYLAVPVGFLFIFFQYLERICSLFLELQGGTSL